MTQIMHISYSRRPRIRSVRTALQWSESRTCLLATLSHSSQCRRPCHVGVLRTSETQHDSPAGHLHDGVGLHGDRAAQHGLPVAVQAVPGDRWAWLSGGLALQVDGFPQPDFHRPQGSDRRHWRLWNTQPRILTIYTSLHTQWGSIVYCKSRCTYCRLYLHHLYVCVRMCVCLCVSVSVCVRVRYL